MYNKVYKNYQINIGQPFQIKVPINIHTIKPAELLHETEEEYNGLPVPEEKIEETAETCLEKARQKVKEIIEEAGLEASKIIEKAGEEAEIIKKKAEEEAWQAGYSRGIEEAKQEYEGLIKEAELIREQAKAEYSELLAGVEHDAVDMILDIARKVIGNEITQNRETILFLVKQAFARCSSREGITVRVSPEDYDFLSANKDKLLSMMENSVEFEIKQDYSLKAGCCVVETPFGTIDAGAQTKLSKIEQVFRDFMGKR